MCRLYRKAALEYYRAYAFLFPTNKAKNAFECMCVCVFAQFYLPLPCLQTMDYDVGLVFDLYQCFNAFRSKSSFPFLNKNKYRKNRCFFRTDD